MRFSLLTLGLTLIAGCAASPSPSAPAMSQTPTQTAQAGSAEVRPTTSADPACVDQFDAFNLEKDTFLSFDEYVNGKYGKIRFIKAPTPQEEAEMKAGLRKEAEAAAPTGDGKLCREEFKRTCG